MLGKKKVKKETLQRHRFGNFELRISEVKVEVEDIAHKLSKHTYNVGGFEYGMLAFLLSQTKQTTDGVAYKTEEEIEDGLKQAEILVTMLAYTNLIFSNKEFQQKYYNLVGEIVNSKSTTATDDNVDREVISEMEKVDEMTNLLK